MRLLVLAKAPVPGRVKTRLCPPYSLPEAASLAAAALADTLDAVRAAPATDRVVALDGDPALVDLRGFRVLTQRGDGLGERLAHAFADAGPGATLLVGMDTPQLTTGLLSDAADLLRRHGAVYGPARDGGWWALGLAEPTAAAGLASVPMSRPDTGARTLEMLAARDIRPAWLPELTDVDTIAEVAEVAAQAPDTRFARAVTAVPVAR